MIYSNKIESLNNLPYYIDSKNQSWIQEEDIIVYLCNNNGAFYMQYFIGNTYLNLHNINGNFPLLNVLIAIHEVFEIISDMANKPAEERDFEKRLPVPIYISISEDRGK
jgi:hypothetical protein